VRRPDPIEREDSTSFVNDIFPIFLAKERDNEPPRVTQFRGTGFRLADDLLVTCWHCVVDEPERGGFAIARVHEGERRMYPLVDVARDSNGSDLATARIYWEPEHALPPPQLVLATKGTITGASVWTYGYPLTTEVPEADGPRFVLNGRYLEGYVTRAFWYEHPSLGTLPAYELDMPAPEGLSGAPLVSLHERHTVVGVIYGRHEVGLVDEFSRVDPETGDKTPEVQRIFSFGLACDTSTLVDLRGLATGGLRLADHLP
jgi:hypothetical protein